MSRRLDESADGGHEPVERLDESSPAGSRSSAYGRSTSAVAYSWASRIMTVSLEMVVPGVLGVWVDRWLGTRVLFTALGFGLGLTLGIWHLLQMVGQTTRRRRGG